MTYFRISEAARLVGKSDDTVRRWIADGLLDAQNDSSGRQIVSGESLARRAADLAPVTAEEPVLRSARNRFTGLVTAVQKEGLMAQVALQCGPNRVVSLMTSEAIDELGLTVGSRATAVVKATMVIIEAEK